MFVTAVIGTVWIFGAIGSASEDNNQPPEQNQAVTQEVMQTPEPVIETKTTIEKTTIPFNSVTIDDPNLEKGEERIVTDGVNGEKHLIYEQKVVDGVVGEKVLVEEKIVSQAVDKVTAIGTKVIVKQPSCNTNYSGACVPIASDVDCSGGSGNGPAYVSGPIYVTGSDVYDLDRDNNDVACE